MKKFFACASLILATCLCFIGCDYRHHHCDRNQVYDEGQCRVRCANDYTCIHDVEAGPSFECDFSAGYCVRKSTRGAVQDGGVTVCDGGVAVQDGGVIRDGGIANSIIARMCCVASTDQMNMWWGSMTRQVTSNGSQCGTFTMSMFDFCRRQSHPGANGGWFTANCNNGDRWRDWTSVNVQSVVDQNGNGLLYTRIRGTENTTGAAEVIVYDTCQN